MSDYIIDVFERISRYLSKTRVEPYIRRKCDCNGNPYWQVYDPILASHYSFGSEQEVKAWLDRRYHFVATKRNSKTF